MKPMPMANDRPGRPHLLLETVGRPAALVGRGAHPAAQGPVATVISAWAEERGLRPGTLSRRLLKGWSVEGALTRPVEPRRPSGEWKRDPNAATRGRKGISRFVRPREGNASGGVVVATANYG